jgi:Ca2+-binding EF-hand superfamily protein
MKRPLSLLLIAASGLALALALPAAANDFAQMDSNNDGSISSSEYESFASATFNRADSNRDDKLSVAEIQAYVGISRGRHGGPSQFSAAQRFQRRDANGDGVISRTEFTQGASARFQELDGNHNNQLTEQELALGF